MCFVTGLKWCQIWSAGRNSSHHDFLLRTSIHNLFVRAPDFYLQKEERGQKER